MSHIIVFNSYLSAPIPETEGYYLDISLTKKTTFIENTPFSRWFGIYEGIDSGAITVYNKDKEQVQLTREQQNSFLH